MKDTKIEWCDHTWNPWIGCTKVSPGCANCYAAAMDKRFGGGHWGKGAPRRRTSAANWRQPLRWNKKTAYDCPACGSTFLQETSAMKGMYWECDCSCTGTYCTQRRPRVFCASMADWLDDEVPIEWLADLLDLIRRTPNLDWQLLTKRPEDWRGRMLDAEVWARDNTAEDDRSSLLARWIGLWRMSREPGGPPPPHNVWIGTTVEDQARADERIPHLLQIPARVRFLSCEPLLGPVDLESMWIDSIHADAAVRPLSGYVSSDGCYQPWTDKRHRLHWVICGGESGPGARPMHPDWARSLRDQCKADGVPFFFKQWGQWGPLPDDADPDEEPWCDAIFGEFHTEQSGFGFVEGCRCKEGTMQLFRRGKKAARRLLDGVEHHGFPAEGGAE